MAENPILKKMKLKPGARAAVVGAPEGYVKSLRPLPAEVEILERLKGDFDWIQVFVKNEAGLKKVLPSVVAALRPDSLLWISFPKGASKIQTDLTRDHGWNSLKKHNLKWVNLISIDETWSAFGLRPLKKGEKTQDWR